MLYNENDSGGTLNFGMDRANPDPLSNETFRARLTLHIGTDSFAGAAATHDHVGYGLPNGLRWSSSGLTWAADQTIAVSLTLRVPGITSIAFNSAGPDNTYDTGESVTATVTFDEAVTVDMTGGTPQLTINVGGTDKVLDYSSGSGTTALVFTGYTVAFGDTDADGISIAADKLDLNGGTIKATADGNPDAVITHDAVADSASHKVSGTGTVTNAAPVFSPTTATRSIAENTTTVTNVGAVIHERHGHGCRRHPDLQHGRHRRGLVDLRRRDPADQDQDRRDLRPTRPRTPTPSRSRSPTAPPPPRSR